MALLSGQRLGAYEILGSLGAGGMGEVYRARDSKLQRDVAIKVLPESLATDRDRLARFEREAQLLAALNHPHIAAIYGVDTVAETQFLVLELVEGDTLADRISRGGALALSEALAIARQIAEALQAAHDKGIIHRDLKPANIALTTDGQVKVLDFGLAKAMEGAPAAQSSAPSATLSPTLSLAMTEAGFILGTAAYMSPEQAKGRPADKRSDVWAFGCVLFEMLTGKRAFEGEDASDTLAGILRGEPDWKALPRGTPPQISEILAGCLAKDRKQRLADIAVVNYLLSDAGRSRQLPASTVTRRAAGSFAVAAALLAATGALAWSWARGDNAPRSVMRFSIVPPSGYGAGPTTTDRQLALSPDGRTLAYIAGQGQLMVRPLDRLDVEPVRTVTDARSPFWSPDGKWIGFVTRSNFEIQRVSVTGGPPELVDRTEGAPRGATWGPDQTIVFATADTQSGLLSVPAGGGDPKVLTRPDRTKRELDHLFPSYLPNGKGVLFTIMAEASSRGAQVAVLDTATGRYKTITAGSSPEYVDGYVVYAVAGGLRAMPFDVERLDVVGDAFPVLDAVTSASNGAAQFSVSRTGSLAHISGGFGGTVTQRSLVWVDRKGGEAPLKEAPPRPYQIARLSGDESKIAITIDDQQRDIYIYDLRTHNLQQVTFDPALDGGQVWYANDERLLFFSQRDGPANLYSQRADGVGGAQRVTSSRLPQFIPTVSADGKLIVVVEQGQGGNLDLNLIRLNSEGQPVTKSESLVSSKGADLHPELSPDGKWLAYASEESGRRHVYVQPFPSLQGKWKISTEPDGGDRPVWRRQGKELFYATLSGTLMAVPYDDLPTFVPRPGQRLFDWPTMAVPGPARPFDVARDGSKFLMIKEGTADGAQPPQVGITVTLNWLEDLKGRVSAK